MKKILGIDEKSNGGGNSAYAPDLRGCTLAESDRQEIETNIIEVIILHLTPFIKNGQKD